MATHVKVLGVLFLVLSATAIVAALFLLLAFGTAGSIVAANVEPHDARLALPLIGLAGTMLVGYLILLAVPALIAGIGLLRFRPWGRILGIVVSVLSLIHIPLGTALGIYGLFVLFNKDTERLFNAAPPSPPTPA